MEIIIALISAGSAIAVCMINNAYQAKKVQTQHDETIALIKYQIAELSDRVDKHNNLIERTYKLEQKAAVYEEKISVANHRIDDLENKEYRNGYRIFNKIRSTAHCRYMPLRRIHNQKHDTK